MAALGVEGVFRDAARRGLVVVFVCRRRDGALRDRKGQNFTASMGSLE
ncbi:hypothetical protein SAMN05446927_0224 [Caballeronia arationis]|uniref:Uncharacterized protein n=1 Tax=Caballeronia arationis TaxID=1777142 RepID=A0A7Z7I3D7_9BURK|nr:hypothetical protein [Caballeronia arationis]SOE47602.1 hypothetical protein SAMN05446927_0224 [Caballeronia arationis]